MKTKLGISVGLMGAAVCLATLFAGYTPAIILAGYVLICEENEWLKKTVVKALAVTFVLSFLSAVIGLIPDALSWIGSVFGVFSGSFKYDIVSSIISLIKKTIDIVEKVVLLCMAFKALKQESVSVPFIDGLVDKNM